MELALEVGLVFLGGLEIYATVAAKERGVHQIDIDYKHIGVIG